MADEIDRKLLDKRVAERYLRNGVLDEKDYEKHVKGLPDLADRAVPMEADLEAPGAYVAEDDEEEDEGDEGEKEP